MCPRNSCNSGTFSEPPSARPSEERVVNHLLRNPSIQYIFLCFDVYPYSRFRQSISLPFSRRHFSKTYLFQRGLPVPLSTKGRIQSPTIDRISHGERQKAFPFFAVQGNIFFAPCRKGSGVVCKRPRRMPFTTQFERPRNLGGWFIERREHSNLGELFILPQFGLIPPSSSKESAPRIRWHGASSAPFHMHFSTIAARTRTRPKQASNKRSRARRVHGSFSFATPLWHSSFFLNLSAYDCSTSPASISL